MYFAKKEEMKDVKQILRENTDNREVRQKFVDSSLNYPTYGRCIDPNDRFDSYMIN